MLFAGSFSASRMMGIIKWLYTTIGVQRRGFYSYLRFKALVVKVALCKRMGEGAGMDEGTLGGKYKTCLEMKSYVF